MNITIHHNRLSGAVVILAVTLDADGAVMFWRPEDPRTGEHVELSSADKWYAVLAMKRAIERMQRGAA